jgi:hypothetical protein
LEFAKMFGLKPGVDGTGSALEVARREADSLNRTLVAREDSLRKVENTANGIVEN